MLHLELLVGLFLAAVILSALARRIGAPYPVFLALGGAVLAFVPIAPFTLPPESRWRSSSRRSCSTRRTTHRSRSPRQLDAAGRAGHLRGWPHHSRRRRRRPLADPGDAVGAGDRARRRGRAARRGRRHRGASPVEATAPHPDDPRRREPAERCERVAHLSPCRRRGRDERLLAGRGRPGFPARRRRQPRRRSGAGVAHAAADGSRAARAHRDHPAVRDDVPGVDAGRAARTVGRA